MMNSNQKDSVELDLQDAHIHFQYANQDFETDSNDHLKADSKNLPALLVDETLISEIQNIPDRFGFKIGDVADLLGIKQYVLRYWEQEFEILRPKKSSNNHRFYSKRDVENAFLIRKLLYRDKFSIEGARQAMRDVKIALKKEKNYNSIVEKFDKKTSDVQEQLKSFITDVRALKNLFS